MKKISIHLAFVSSLMMSSALAVSKTPPTVPAGQKVHKEIKAGQVVPTSPPPTSAVISGDKTKSKK